MASTDGMRDESGVPELEGRVLDARYRISSLLGAGGMGAVFSGTQITLDKPVAIKVLRPEYARRSEAVKRFLREARAASKINHRNVVEVIDFGQTEDGLVYFVMEFLDGMDLSHLLADAAPVAWPRAKSLLMQIARALKAAHGKGIIHRDVKPANCFLVATPDGEPDYVKVLDFGIAKVIEAEEQGSAGLTSTAQVMGTALYMAPEQAMGRTIDARTDVYALGVLAFEMLSGKKPFTGATAFEVLMKRVAEPPPRARDVAPHLSAHVEDFLQRAMCRDPVGRYQNMREFEDALVAIPDARGQRKTAVALPDAEATTTPDARPAPAAAPAEAVGAETATSSRHRIAEPPTDPKPHTVAYSGRDLQRLGVPIPQSDASTESGPALDLPNLPRRAVDPSTRLEFGDPPSGVETVIGTDVGPSALAGRVGGGGRTAILGVAAVVMLGVAAYWFGTDRGSATELTTAQREPSGPTSSRPTPAPSDPPTQAAGDPSQRGVEAEADALSIGDEVAAKAPATGKDPMAGEDDSDPLARPTEAGPDSKPAGGSETPPTPVESAPKSKPKPKPKATPKAKPQTDASTLGRIRSKAKSQCGRDADGSIKIDLWVEASGNVPDMLRDVGSTADKTAQACVQRILRATAFPPGAARRVKLRVDL